MAVTAAWRLLPAKPQKGVEHWKKANFFPAGSALLKGSLTGKGLGCPTKGAIAFFAPSTSTFADCEVFAADEPDAEPEPQAARDTTASAETSAPNVRQVLRPDRSRVALPCLGSPICASTCSTL